MNLKYVQELRDEETIGTQGREIGMARLDADLISLVLHEVNFSSSKENKRNLNPRIVNPVGQRICFRRIKGGGVAYNFLV